MRAKLTSRGRWVIRYGAAVAAAIAGLLVRLALEAWVGPGLATFITFYPGVMAVALLGGLGPGLVTTAVSALLADYWVIPPSGFGVEKPVDVVNLLFFSCMGLFMSLVAEYSRHAGRKAAAYDQEQALRETRREKELLASIIERASQPFGMGYHDGRLGLFNRAFAELTGYTAEELRSMDWIRTLTPPEWRELEHQKLEELNRTGQPVRYEKEYLRKDGSRVPIELLVHLARDAEDKPEYYYSFLTDITKRRQAEQAERRLKAELQRHVAQLRAANDALSASRKAALNLVEDAIQARKQAEQASMELRNVSEQRRLALEASDLGTWDYHFQTGDVFWDERCREMWGLPQAEKIDYAGAIAAIHPEDRAGVDEAVKEALAGKDGGAYHHEFRVVWPDGSVHWIASHGRVYFQGEGDQCRPTRFIGANREVTAEKQAAEAVRASEERYRGLVELSPEGVFVNRNDRIVLVNPAALQLFGASKAEQLLGKSPFEVFHPNFHAMMRERISRVLAGQRAPLLEEKIVRLDGVAVDVEVVAAPLIDQGERAILVLLRDITERKQAQAALQQTTEDLERSNRDLEQFAYVASHDLQEPLRAVGGYVKLLQHRFPETLDAKARDYIAGAVDGALRMERLITDLLAYSRVGTSGGNFAPADLGAVLDQALRNLHAGIESAQATVTHDPLPTLSVDATQIMQLFQNLIGNALKFHSESPPRIHIGVQKKEERWVFSVRDNGIGIDPQYSERIFQVFQRLHTRRKYPGTGIGLAICRRIVERHGGTIWVESQAGQGSTFYFSFPAHPRIIHQAI
jgi:PAS domain S-box-containing protein